MYLATLGRFLTRDPLPQNGALDVLFDNNWFDRWLTLMRHLYGYTSGNPVNRVDPSGLKCCGPDVTRWFATEIALFQAEAKKAADDFANASSTAEFAEPNEAIAAQLAIATINLKLTLRRLALKADYKERDFSHPDCPNACDDSVTLAGNCVGTNQLGNIMYGILASLLSQVDEAREYGRGNTTWGQRAMGATGPKPPWTAENEAYRETAFDIGVQFASTRRYHGLMELNPKAPVGQGYTACRPCPANYSGPHTDFTTPPMVNPAGN